MSQSSPVVNTAELHPGKVLRICNHGGLQLRRSGTEDLRFYFSLYDYQFDADSGPGCVAVVRLLDEPPLEIVLTDNPGLVAAFHQRRAAGGYAPLEFPMRTAQFGRVFTASTAAWAVAADGFHLTVEFAGLDVPTLTVGRHPTDDAIDTVGVAREAESARVSLDGREIVGDLFPNEGYRPWVGYAFRSALVTMSEVHIERDGIEIVTRRDAG